MDPKVLERLAQKYSCDFTVLAKLAEELTEARERIVILEHALLPFAMVYELRKKLGKGVEWKKFLKDHQYGYAREAMIDRVLFELHRPPRKPSKKSP